MTIDKQHFIDALRGATELIRDAAAGQMPAHTFLDRYGNFYYSGALDGHEDEPELSKLIESMPDLVRLHEEVQREVVNATYMGPFENRISLLDTGRISTNEAEARLKNIASRYNLTALLKSISHL